MIEVFMTMHPAVQALAVLVGGVCAAIALGALFLLLLIVVATLANRMGRSE